MCLLSEQGVWACPSTMDFHDTTREVAKVWEPVGELVEEEEAWMPGSLRGPEVASPITDTGSQPDGHWT